MEIVKKSFSMRGIDGNDLSVSETLDRLEAVVSIRQNEDGKISTVVLNQVQWRAFCGLYYKIEVRVEDVGDPQGTGRTVAGCG